MNQWCWELPRCRRRIQKASGSCLKCALNTPIQMCGLRSHQAIGTHQCPLDCSPTQRTRMSDFGPCTKGIMGSVGTHVQASLGLRAVHVLTQAAESTSNWGSSLCKCPVHPTSCQNRPAGQKRRWSLSPLVGGPGPQCPALSALLSLWHGLYLQSSPLRPGLTSESPGRRGQEDWLGGDSGPAEMD